MLNIPNKPPYQPSIPGPEGTPPKTGKKFTVSAGLVDQSGVLFEQFVNIEKLQYWERVFSTDVSSGTFILDKSTTFDVGVSATSTAELSAQFGSLIEVNGFLTLGLSQTISLNVASTTTQTRIIEVPEEMCMTFVLWQLVDEYRITVTTEGLFGRTSSKTTIFTERQNVFGEESLFYSKKSASQRSTTSPRTAKLIRQQFNTPYCITYPGAKFILFGKQSDDGTVTLADVSGNFTLGNGVPSNALSDDLMALITETPRKQIDTFGLLELYSGDMTPLFNKTNLGGVKGIDKTNNLLFDLINNADQDSLAQASNFTLEEAEISAIVAQRNRAIETSNLIDDNPALNRTIIEKLLIPNIT